MQLACLNTAWSRSTGNQTKAQRSNTALRYGGYSYDSDFTPAKLTRIFVFAFILRPDYHQNNRQDEREWNLQKQDQLCLSRDTPTAKNQYMK